MYGPLMAQMTAAAMLGGVGFAENAARHMAQMVQAH